MNISSHQKTAADGGRTTRVEWNRRNLRGLLHPVRTFLQRIRDVTRVVRGGLVHSRPNTPTFSHGYTNRGHLKF